MKQCEVDGCNKASNNRDKYCGMHRARLARHGSFELPARQSPIDMAMARIEMIPESGCWIWMGALNNKGYSILKGAQFGFHGEQYGHRVMFLAYGNKLSGEQVLCHVCDTPCCINPAHLFAGTHMDNFLDARSKNRLNGQAKLSAAQISEIRRDKRTQKTIAAEYGICQSNVSRIKSAETWKWVDEQPEVIDLPVILGVR